ncbi:flavin reductase family protein [Kaistia sp. 32K]|uniref:flavin reductase family protein n=1 Tax=Kaistia sp. 32K TaxID=2795690 RepID=UPI0019157D44|nr:flavin reductase family protein [Kaistia sp. 32K]
MNGALRLDLLHAAGAVTKQTFAEAMSHLASTVCVVSAGQGARRLGRTATAVFSLSANPPSVVVSIRSGSDLARAIVEEGGFSVAMLSEDQEGIGDAFAGRVPPETRFLLGVWESWPSGRPRLLGASATLDCELGGSVAVADHELFVGVITATDAPGHARPLLWNRRHYQSLKPHAADDQPDAAQHDRGTAAV